MPVIHSGLCGCRVIFDVLDSRVTALCRTARPNRCSGRSLRQLMSVSRIRQRRTRIPGGGERRRSFEAEEFDRRVYRAEVRRCREVIDAGECDQRGRRQRRHQSVGRPHPVPVAQDHQDREMRSRQRLLGERLARPTEEGRKRSRLVSCDRAGRRKVRARTSSGSSLPSGAVTSAAGSPDSNALSPNPRRTIRSKRSGSATARRRSSSARRRTRLLRWARAPVVRSEPPHPRRCNRPDRSAAETIRDPGGRWRG